MKKRITAALLMLVMVISLLPVRADAAVYKLGDTIEKAGSALPQAPEYALEDADLYQWYTMDKNKDGVITPDDGTMMKEPFWCPSEHAVGKHLRKCWVQYGTMYTFYVGLKEGVNINPDPGGPSNPQLPPYSDPYAEYPAGSAYFTLRNVGPEGEPLQDIVYYLLDGAGSVKGNFRTNERGEIFFGGLTLAKGTPDVQTWTLKQNPLPEALADSYEHIVPLWHVTVERMGDGTFAVTNITFDDGSANLLEAGTNVLTVVNQPILYNMMVTLQPVLLKDGEQIQFARPNDLKVSVTIQAPDGTALPTVTLPDGAGPQVYLPDLPGGTYTVTDITCENAEIEGYTLGEPYAVVALPKPDENAERPVLEQNYIELSSTYPIPDFWIYLPYTENEPEIEISNTISIRIVDDAENSLTGGTVALMDGEEVIQTFNDTNGYTLDLGERLNTKKTYSLVQTQTPEGYQDAPEKYKVEVGKKLDGTPQVLLKKDQTFLENVVSFFSGGDGVVIDPVTGVQQAIFTNVRKTTQVQLTYDADVTFTEGTMEDAALVETCGSANSFTLKWADATGESSAVMQVADGETKTFEAEIPYGADYTITGIIAEGTTFQETQEITGKVELDDLDTPIHIDAEGKFTVVPGVSEPLTLIAVDRDDTTKKLAGVTFQQRMEGAEDTITYVTDKAGRIQIPGASVPCSFELEEMEAPEGYKKPSPIQVNVGVRYGRGTDSYTLMQNLAATPEEHGAVERQEDGTYFVKNTPIEVGKPVVDEHSNKLLIRVVDESGNQVEGTTVTMGNKNYTNGDVIDLEPLVKEGQTLNYNVVQTKSVTGHQIAAENYKVTVSRKNDTVKVNVEDANQGVLGQIFNKTEYPYGPEGEWVLTFTNVRMTAQLRLTLEVAMNFVNGSWHDLEFEKKYKEETEYEFLLSWEDAFTREQESAKLVHGQSHLFDMQVPYGVEYKLICVNPKGYFDTTYRNAKSTVVDTTALREGMQITATNTYIIEPDPDADPVEVHLTKVDASTKKPLEGVAFELLDSDDRKLASYTTGADGKIDIVDTLKIGGSYALKETAALSGYEKPSDPVKVHVDAEYKLFTASGKPVLKQSFAASISDKTVEEQEDGSYQLKNYKEGERPKDSSSSKGNNPKTGDRFDVTLWCGIMLISAVSAVLVAADAAKKKRRAY